MSPVRPRLDATQHKEMNSAKYKNAEQSKASNGVRHWFYTYVLKSEKNGNFYTGTAKNLKQKLRKHNMGVVPSTRYIGGLTG